MMIEVKIRVSPIILRELALAGDLRATRINELGAGETGPKKTFYAKTAKELRDACKSLRAAYDASKELLQQPGEG